MGVPETNDQAEVQERKTTVIFTGPMVALVDDLVRRYTVLAVVVRAAILGFSRMSREDQSNLIWELNDPEKPPATGDSRILGTPEEVVAEADALAARQAARAARASTRKTRRA